MNAWMADERTERTENYAREWVSNGVGDNRASKNKLLGGARFQNQAILGMTLPHCGMIRLNCAMEVAR